MGYEPTLIIRKKDLERAVDILEREQDSQDGITADVAKYLLRVFEKNQVVTFGRLELVLCQPDLSPFNLSVRERLKALGIDFRESN